jgi:CPA1 family monovalent cation:H+ antiporter
MSGSRGALTLSACFSIPLTLSDGTPFPLRDLILFVCGGVIIVTLLVSNILLPLLSPKTAQENNREEAAALKKMLEAAIAVIKSEITDENERAALSLVTYYELLLSERLQNGGHMTPTERKQEIEIFKIGLEAEKAEIDRLFRDGTFSRAALLHILQPLGYIENFFNRRHSIPAFIRTVSHRAHLLSGRHRDAALDVDEIARAKAHTTRVAIEAIERKIVPENEAISKRTIAHYISILDVFTQYRLGEKGRLYAEEKRQLELRAIQIQKVAVQQMLESGEISYAIAAKLRRDIQFEEVALIKEMEN